MLPLTSTQNTTIAGAAKARFLSFGGGYHEKYKEKRQGEPGLLCEMGRLRSGLQPDTHLQQIVVALARLSQRRRLDFLPHIFLH
jgi:hypothetical protein